MTAEPSVARIERVGRTDFLDVLPLLRAQYDEHDIAYDETELSGALEGLVTHGERGAVLVARTDRAVGLAVLSTTWTLEHAGLVAWLDELYVVPPMRGAGLGARLLRAAMECATAMGCRAIELEVVHDHARAEALYERAGFHALPRRRFSKNLGDAG